MSYLALAMNLIRHAIQSQIVRDVGRYAVRQATAAVVREIRRRTASSYTPRIH